ncbi:uncharacterized protein LOC123717326 [Pieris brassicae]|uniref:uncharacterized protein LOC123717326 n=1 Tax=Pieris brassicae TaxID=7116 RepID=UPI001E65F896|nr:uncharacterized protein LOC123717326 [Pieris brassicae]
MNVEEKNSKEESEAEEDEPVNNSVGDDKAVADKTENDSKVLTENEAQVDEPDNASIAENKAEVVESDQEQADRSTENVQHKKNNYVTPKPRKSPDYYIDDA